MNGKKMKILDIATGTGAHAYELAKMGHHVVGIDLDDNMLEKARMKVKDNNKLSFLNADGTRLPFDSNGFDAATISFAMHDVPTEIGIDILKEAKRVVKKDGFILIVDYNNLKGSLGAKFLYPIALLYESPNYKSFVRRNLSFYLKEVNLKIIEKNTFLGAVQFTRLISVYP